LTRPSTVHFDNLIEFSGQRVRLLEDKVEDLQDRVGNLEGRKTG
jgi:hypothetical protein